MKNELKVVYVVLREKALYRAYTEYGEAHDLAEHLKEVHPNQEIEIDATVLWNASKNED